MMTLETQETQKGPCVESCMTATVTNCTCGCNGRNHGVLRTERLDNFEQEEM